MNAAPGRVVAACVVGGLTCVAMVPAASGQEVRASADVTGLAGYSNNPYNEVDGTSSAFAEVRLLPVVSATSQYTTWALHGSARLRHYFSHYTDEDAYSADFDFQHRLNTHDTITAGLGFTDSRNRLEDLLGDDASGVITPPAPISGEDISLIGTRTRRYRAYAGASFTISPRMTLSLNADASAARYQSSTFSGYDTYGGSANVSRRLSERVQVGLFGSVTKSNYRDAQRPDSTVVSFGASGSIQTSSRWTISGQLGAAIVNNTGLLARRTVGIVGNGQLCRTGEYDSVCLTAARQYLATGFAGTTPQSTLGVTYTRRLSEVDRVTVGVNGIKGGGEAGRDTSDSYLRGQAQYGHDFAPRLQGSATTFYRKVFGGGLGRPSDYGATLGLTYRFGESR